MSETQTDKQHRTWQVPECPLLIEYSPALLDEIRLAVVDAFFSLPRGGAEIGGVLFGNHDDGSVRITAFRPMECEHAMGPTFVLSEKDRTRLRAQLEESRDDALLRGLEIVGWYHSHTRSEIFLSPLDLEIYSEFFPQPWQVALVLRPAGMKPTRAGFFFRDQSGQIHSSASYQEFIAGVEAGPHGSGNGRPLMPVAASAQAPTPAPQADPLPTSSGDYATEEAESKEERPPAAPETSLMLQRLEGVVARRSVDVGPAIDGRPADFVPPAFLIPPERRRSRAGLWLALVSLAAAGATAYFTSGYWMKGLSAKPVYLHLQALDRGGQLRIQWDREAMNSANVQEGSLEILDGVHATTIALDAARLLGGSFEYVRRSEAVEAHLTVRTRKGNTLEEFTTFYGPPPKPEGALDIGQTKPSADLAAEAERARGDLKKEELRSLELQRSLDQMREQVRRNEQRKRVENQMPATAQPRNDARPPVNSATPPAQPSNNVNPGSRPSPSTSNAAPAGKPQGVAQSAVTQAINSPAPLPDAPLVAVERGEALPTALQPAPRPPVSPPRPMSRPSPQPPLSGRWVYSHALKSGSPFPPESVTLTLTETLDRVRGNFAARYKVPKGQKMNPRVNFNFEGPLHAGSSKFTFAAGDGLKGEIELIRLPGKQNAIEVVWYSDRDRLTFDDVFYRVP